MDVLYQCNKDAKVAEISITEMIQNEDGYVKRKKFEVQSSWFRVPSSWFRVRSSEFGV